MAPPKGMRRVLLTALLSSATDAFVNRCGSTWGELTILTNHDSAGQRARYGMIHVPVLTLLDDAAELVCKARRHSS